MPHNQELNSAEKDTVMERSRRTPATYLIALYAMVGGLVFFLIQTSKLFRPEAAEVEMAKLPFGRFDWGYVWSDTLVAGPALFLGGILLLTRNRSTHRLGRLWVFTGFAINLYAMIFIWVGFWAVGQPIRGVALWSNVVLTALGVLSMIYLAVQTMKEDIPVQP
jgi:hypothetical protein